jgi:AGCS family alanine or glycine:cation symporter
MILVYMVGGIAILLLNLNQLLSIFQLILTSAFQGSAVAGGFVGVSIVISQGFRRAAFSNEAGMGTEVMAISATKNNEPIRSGLVAMIGPIIDTLIVCSITGFVILLSNDWSQGQLSGVSLTQAAFENHLGIIGRIIVFFSVVTFGLSTMFGYSYYGCKCASYLFGVEAKQIYRIFYIATIAISAVLSIDLAINILDSMFALMAFPTMISAIYLAPNINKEAKKYFLNLKKEK